jgi:hypothetical protein
MSTKQTSLLQGTLDLLILKALGAGELHGLGVSHRIGKLRKGHFSSSLVRYSWLCTAWRKQAG